MADKPTDAPANDSGNKEESAPAQVHGKSLSEQDLKGWGDEVTIDEKSAKTEQNVLHKEFEDAVKQESGEDGDEQEDDKEVKPTEKTNAEQAQSNEIVTEPVLPEDPGEFTPGDYNFSVTTYDADGNKPKTTEISSIADWEKLLETEPNLGNSLAVNKAFRAAQKMESGLERDEADYTAKVEKYNEAVEAENTRQGRNETIFKEINYLMDSGDLPKLTQEELNNLDWSDAEVVKAHPNIAKHNELLAFMRTENTKRMKHGLNPLSSAMDAFNAMQLDSNRQASVKQKKAAGEARKQAGARVASGSSTPLSSAPRGIAVGRVGDLTRLGQNWNV